MDVPPMDPIMVSKREQASTMAIDANGSAVMTNVKP
jgi:hypothetical protein